MVVEKKDRWDIEWLAYRGGQNTPLIILDMETQEEVLIPNEKTTDIHPIWVDNTIYFLSDRDWNMNVWAYNIADKSLKQVTKLKNTDIKYLTHYKGELLIEQNGYLHTVDPKNGRTKQLKFEINADFPWAETKWEDVSRRASAVSLSPTGKRALMQSRGEIFTVPVEYGDTRNLTQSSDAADRRPIWSPKGDQIAWVSDQGGQGYALYLTDQDGMSPAKRIPLGESKLIWSPTWSPDGKHIAFADNQVRIKVLNLETSAIETIDIGGNNLDRGRTGLTWAPDSKKLAYVKSGSNNFRRIMIWDADTKTTETLTDPFADAFAPAWDRDKKHFYFLASTDLALGSGWANTSAITADPSYAAYVVVLQKGQDSPFIPRSDEEEVKKEKKEDKKEDAKKEADKKAEAEKKPEEKKTEATEKKKEDKGIKIDFDGIARRTIALKIPVANYVATLSGPAGSVFLAERKPGTFSLTLQKFTLKDRKAAEYLSGVRQFSMSADGKKLLTQTG
ncbi:MAG: protease, partial [Bacteroidota bacterium]